MNPSIDFFARQFDRQIASDDYALHPFEQLVAAASARPRAGLGDCEGLEWREEEFPAGASQIKRFATLVAERPA